MSTKQVVKEQRTEKFNRAGIKQKELMNKSL